MLLSSKKEQQNLDVDGNESNEDIAGEMTWPKPVFSHDIIKAQLKNKKKRVHSNSFSHSGTNGLSINGVTSDRDSLVHAMQKVRVSSSRLPYSKNSKKSRNGFKPSPNKWVGKNLPKPIEDMDEIEIDHNDPDYDSDANDPVFLEEICVSLPDEKFEEHLDSLLKEYFSHSKSEEFITALSELNPSSSQRRRLPYLCINFALQFKLRECEMTSSLLSDMYDYVITPPQMQQGFHLLLDSLSEIVVDVPKAPEYVGRFLARAIADEILPPCFVKTQRSSLLSEAVVQCHQGHHHHLCQNMSPLTILNGHSASLDDTTSTSVASGADTHIEMGGGATVVVAPRVTLRSNSGGDTCPQPVAGGGLFPKKHPSSSGDTGGHSSGIGSVMEDDPTASFAVIKQALDKADSLLVMDHAYARLSHVWGVKVGHCANRFLVGKMKELLNEMLVSNDVEEARRCLQELDSPHFHHELVYQGVLLVIEKNNDVTNERIARLLNYLSNTVVLTDNQLITGMKRIYTDMPEIQIDVPKAYTYLEQFLNLSESLGFMPKELVKEMPTKSRRRFISEGDALHNRKKFDDES